MLAQIEPVEGAESVLLILTKVTKVVVAVGVNLAPEAVLLIVLEFALVNFALL